MVPTVERGLRLAAFWSMETARESPSLKSTSRLCLLPGNRRAAAQSPPRTRPCRARRWPPDAGKQDGRGGRQGEHRMDNEARQRMARIAEATGRLLASATTLTDTGMREPSLLPGWTRGHVLTHVARNADG